MRLHCNCLNRQHTRSGSNNVCEAQHVQQSPRQRHFVGHLSGVASPAAAAAAAADAADCACAAAAAALLTMGTGTGTGTGTGDGDGEAPAAAAAAACFRRRPLLPADTQASPNRTVYDFKQKLVDCTISLDTSIAAVDMVHLHVTCSCAHQARCSAPPLQHFRIRAHES